MLSFSTMSTAQKHKSSGHIQDFYIAAKRIEAYSTEENGITTEFFTHSSYNIFLLAAVRSANRNNAENLNDSS